MPWVHENETQKLEVQIDEAEAWLKTELEKQKKLQLTDNPVLTSEAVFEQLRPVAKASQALFRRPKPRDWDKKLKEKLAKLMNETMANMTNGTYTSEDGVETVTEGGAGEGSGEEQQTPSDNEEATGSSQEEEAGDSQQDSDSEEPEPKDEL